MRRPHLVLSFHGAYLVKWNILPEILSPPFSAVEQITWKLFHLPENFSPKQLLSGAVEDGQEEAVKFFEAWKAQVETIIWFSGD